MTLTADLQSIAGVDPRPIAEAIDRDTLPEITPLPGRSVLRSTLAMSAACLGAIVVASSLHSGSAWAGINSVAAGLGLVGRRPPRRFDATLGLVALGTVVGGCFALALAERALPSRVRRSRIGTAALVGGAGFAADRLLLKDTLVPTFVRTLGPIGTLLKYSAIGFAAS